MQGVAGGETFDRRDLLALGGQRQRQAGDYATVVNQHGAGAALAVIATLLAAGHSKMLAQRVEHGRARIDAQMLVLAIDMQRDVDG